MMTTKRIFQGLKVVSLLVILFLVGSRCQNERILIEDESEQDNLKENSALKNLLHNISLHDGSFDDQIDGANCFSIQFPYTVIHEGTVYEIKEATDLQNFPEGTVSFQIQFPITVAHSSHQLQEVSSQSMLMALAEKCIIADPDIECIDLVYPIEVAAFDTRTETINTLKIYHDKDLYDLTLRTILSNRLSIQYPIQVITKNGDTLNIGHNEALEAAIETFAGICNEQDGE